MNKLNWGCGSIQPQGWYNVDKDPAFQQYKPGTPFTLQSTDKFTTNFFDIIVAHASIQQIEWHRLVDELEELHRILKPNGVLRISLPDIDAGFRAYQKGDIDWFPNSEEDLDNRFSAWLTWYSTSKNLMTYITLGDFLIKAGFRLVYKKNFKQTETPGAEELDTRENEFYFVEAIK